MGVARATQLTKELADLLVHTFLLLVLAAVARSLRGVFGTHGLVFGTHMPPQLSQPNSGGGRSRGLGTS